jgi:hypothetical protein
MPGGRCLGRAATATIHRDHRAPGLPSLSHDHPGGLVLPRGSGAACATLSTVGCFRSLLLVICPYLYLAKVLVSDLEPTRVGYGKFGGNILQSNDFS